MSSESMEHQLQCSVIQSNTQIHNLRAPDGAGASSLNSALSQSPWNISLSPSKQQFESFQPMFFSRFFLLSVS